MNNRIKTDESMHNCHDSVVVNVVIENVIVVVDVVPICYCYHFSVDIVFNLSYVY